MRDLFFCVCLAPALRTLIKVFRGLFRTAATTRERACSSNIGHGMTRVRKRFRRSVVPNVAAGLARTAGFDDLLCLRHTSGLYPQGLQIESVLEWNTVTIGAKSPTSQSDA